MKRGLIECRHNGLTLYRENQLLRITMGGELGKAQRTYLIEFENDLKETKLLVLSNSYLHELDSW